MSLNSSIVAALRGPFLVIGFVLAGLMRQGWCHVGPSRSLPPADRRDEPERIKPPAKSASQCRLQGSRKAR